MPCHVMWQSCFCSAIRPLMCQLFYLFAFKIMATFQIIVLLTRNFNLTSKFISYVNFAVIHHQLSTILCLYWHSRRKRTWRPVREPTESESLHTRTEGSLERRTAQYQEQDLTRTAMLLSIIPASCTSCSLYSSGLKNKEVSFGVF